MVALFYFSTLELRFGCVMVALWLCYGYVLVVLWLHYGCVMAMVIPGDYIISQMLDYI